MTNLFSFLMASATASSLSSTAVLTSPSKTPFPFPSYHANPPFFTLQPTLLTRNAQLKKWSLLIQSYCRHHRLYRLPLIDAVNSPLFHNAQIRKRLSLMDARTVVDWMASEEGERRAEWVGREQEKASVWVWWRRPEEWAEVLSGWVEETGQKGSVLTLYELTQGVATVDRGGCAAGHNWRCEWLTGLCRVPWDGPRGPAAIT